MIIELDVEIIGYCALSYLPQVQDDISLRLWRDIRPSFFNLSQYDRPWHPLIYFDFSEFLTSLKLTLITKVLNPNSVHNWKCIFIKQLKFPNNIEISIENSFIREDF